MLLGWESFNFGLDFELYCSKGLWLCNFSCFSSFVAVNLLWLCFRRGKWWVCGLFLCLTANFSSQFLYGGMCTSMTRREKGAQTPLVWVSCCRRVRHRLWLYDRLLWARNGWLFHRSKRLLRVCSLITELTVESTPHFQAYVRG